jgi:hypothetical protein
MVQEAFHSNQARGDKGMVININMANALDHVKHSFLYNVLYKFGF